MVYRLELVKTDAIIPCYTYMVCLRVMFQFVFGVVLNGYGYEMIIANSNPTRARGISVNCFHDIDS